MPQAQTTAGAKKSRVCFIYFHFIYFFNDDPEAASSAGGKNPTPAPNCRDRVCGGVGVKLDHVF
jgi:hypothetical protein